MKTKYRLAMLLPVALLSACGSDDDDNNDTQHFQYQVEVSNLTHAQPMSPVAIAINEHNNPAWMAGESASLGLEKLAEGGDNSDWLAEQQSQGAYATLSGEGILLPGATMRWTVDYDSEQEMADLALASMLVNTNDAFSGVAGLKLPQGVGESVMHYAKVWDAGTEANSESAGTIPGPADGGEGYAPARDNDGLIRIHAGVISQDDGLPSSVLTEQHRFDSPAMRITVSRIQ